MLFKYNAMHHRARIVLDNLIVSTSSSRGETDYEIGEAIHSTVTTHKRRTLLSLAAFLASRSLSLCR